MIADTSALVAFFNADDKHHVGTREAFAATGHIVVSPCILAELDYLLAMRMGSAVSNAALGYIASRVASGRWEVPGIGQSLLAAHAVLQDYPEIGLSDATNVVLAREFRTDAIATLDMRHFRMIRPLTPHPAFRLLPADL
ncbi:PIN domain-containing protein [Glycomyces buryatensis]|uniref:PIN domain-containing protein n=1 Tax=Glycomyces buryatensis TaxID=2570927 RepID=UPI0014562E2A|nr:PIN domain-containing protein [Glycomyces buryatensis]